MRAGEEEVRAEVGERLVAAVRLASSELQAAAVEKTQACHLPVRARRPVPALVHHGARRY